MSRVVFLRFAAPLLVPLRIDYSVTVIPQVLCTTPAGLASWHVSHHVELLTKVTTTRLSVAPPGVDLLLSSLFSTSFVAVASRLSALDNRLCNRNKTATGLVAPPGSGDGENTLSRTPPTARVCFCDLGIVRIASAMKKRSKLIIKVNL